MRTLKQSASGLCLTFVLGAFGGFQGAAADTADTSDATDSNYETSLSFEYGSGLDFTGESALPRPISNDGQATVEAGFVYDETWSFSYSHFEADDDTDGNGFEVGFSPTCLPGGSTRCAFGARWDENGDDTYTRLFAGIRGGVPGVSPLMDESARGKNPIKWNLGLSNYSGDRSDTVVTAGIGIPIFLIGDEHQNVKFGIDVGGAYSVDEDESEPQWGATLEFHLIEHVDIYVGYGATATLGQDRVLGDTEHDVNAGITFSFP